MVLILNSFLLLILCAPFLESACTCNGFVTERGQGECKTTYKVVTEGFASWFLLWEIFPEEVEGLNGFGFGGKLTDALQGATFCFVEEGECKDQLRAKYQYPGDYHCYYFCCWCYCFDYYSHLYMYCFAGEPRRQISFSACTNFKFRPCLTVTGKACQFPFT